MNLITWNTNMAFRKKWPQILKHNPEILIIQECENHSKFKQNQLIPEYNEHIWIGDNQNKGIGVYSFNNFHIEQSNDYAPEFRYILPINVTGEKDFKLFAIWAMPHKIIKTQGYIGQIWGAINFYQKLLENDTMLIGDWNSNAIWDQSRKIGNHSQVVDFLLKFNITSIYHAISGEEHGQETKPTIFFRKNQLDPFHIDYCFATQTMINQNTSVEVGHYDDWIGLSDHVPLIVNNLN